MSALMDKDGVTQTSQKAIEAVVQDFYTDLFRSSIPVAKCVLPPAEEAPPSLEKRSLPHWMQVARDRAVWKSCGSR
ncbi:hypothetical protein Q1695_008069 [Nippostrongylus brasiliensis]|nr:hypothetical protein Q1695_008069 [Nippostrongylus brasiliensis]